MIDKGWQWIDFESARLKGQSLSPIYSPQYCRPEAYRARASSSAVTAAAAAKKGCEFADDVWSFGMVMFTVLTGQPYFKDQKEAIHALNDSKFKIPPEMLDRISPLSKSAAELLRGILIDRTVGDA